MLELKIEVYQLQYIAFYGSQVFNWIFLVGESQNITNFQFADLALFRAQEDTGQYYE